MKLIRRHQHNLLSRIPNLGLSKLVRILCVGVNDTSTLVGHFVSSPREREKRDKRDLFVCIEVLRPSQPNRVMSSAVSLPNHTFTGQA